MLKPITQLMLPLLRSTTKTILSFCDQQLVGFTSRQPRSLLQHPTRNSLLCPATARPPSPGASCPITQGGFVKHRRRICLTLASHLASLMMTLRPGSLSQRSSVIHGTHPGSWMCWMSPAGIQGCNGDTEQSAVPGWAVARALLREIPGPWLKALPECLEQQNLFFFFFFPSPPSVLMKK